MSRYEITQKPAYVMGGLIAAAGLGLAWLLPGIFPGALQKLVLGAVIGGFGVAAAGRVWPGLPLKQIHIYGLAMAAYGALCGLIAGG